MRYDGAAPPARGGPKAGRMAMAAIDPKTLRGDWSYPTRVRFGPGRIAELPEACRALGIARPLLITDPGLAEQALGQRVLNDRPRRRPCLRPVRGNPAEPDRQPTSSAGSRRCAPAATTA